MAVAAEVVDGPFSRMWASRGWDAEQPTSRRAPPGVPIVPSSAPVQPPHYPPPWRAGVAASPRGGRGRTPTVAGGCAASLASPQPRLWRTVSAPRQLLQRLRRSRPWNLMTAEASAPRRQRVRARGGGEAAVPGGVVGGDAARRLDEGPPGRNSARGWLRGCPMAMDADRGPGRTASRWSSEVEAAAD